MKARQLLFGVVLLAVNAAASACDLPALVAIPAASSLGEAAPQLLVRTRAYVAGIQAYTACVQAELAAAGGDAAPPSVRAQLTARNNNAVAEARTVLALFEQRVAPPGDLYLADYIAGEGLDCIPTSRLMETGVINDLAVLFIERDGSAYLNVLEESCADLASSGKFDVSTSSQSGELRICSGEVLEPFRFDAASARKRECGLGKFFELTKEQMATLTSSRNSARPAAATAESAPREETPAPRRTER
jgi:hypothetical protein